MCTNSISPRASPSDKTINRGPRHGPVCVANRVAKSSQHPVHKVLGQLDYKPQNLLFIARVDLMGRLKLRSLVFFAIQMGQQILRLIVQLSKDLMDWVSRRLCYTFGDTDRSVSWTSVYSLIRRTCPGGDGVCTHVNSRRKALLYRDF